MIKSFVICEKCGRRMSIQKYKEHIKKEREKAKKEVEELIKREKILTTNEIKDLIKLPISQTYRILSELEGKKIESIGAGVWKYKRRRLE